MDAQREALVRVMRAYVDSMPPELTRGIAHELARELAGMVDPNVIRRDCPFCGRERSRTDDNHAPDCPYWDFMAATA